MSSLPLTAAPHRIMFFAGVLQFAAALAFWARELAGRHLEGWMPLDLAVPSSAVHAWLMVLGLFPFFIFGFLMTTYPRWMNCPPVPPRRYIPAAALLAAGATVYFSGLGQGIEWLQAGAVLHLAGWSLACYALLAVYRTAGANTRRYYESHLNVAFTFGAMAGAGYLLWLFGAPYAVFEFSVRAAVWLFLIPVLVTVAHRMIPFFSHSALPRYVMVQPRWSLPLLWCGVIGHVALDTLGAHAALILPDALLLFLGLYHSMAWGFRRSLSVPLLGALHVAFAWFAVGMALYVFQALVWLLMGEPVLGRAPLHALGIGFAGGMVVAMVTRVSRGHSGRPMEMDRLDRAVSAGVSLVALLRVLADFAAAPVTLSLIAVLLWLALLLPWLMRYAFYYLRPRADGAPG